MSRQLQQMELFPASQIAESLGNNDRLMEMILERNNIIRAWKQVCANKGAPGVDGMKTSQLGNYLAKHWPEIEQDLLNCKHKPLPVTPNRTAVSVYLESLRCWTGLSSRPYPRSWNRYGNPFSLNAAMDSDQADPHTMRLCRVKGTWLKVIHMSWIWTCLNFSTEFHTTA